MTPSSASAFRIHVSNRLEALAEELAQELREPPADALCPERIVVPHPGLGRWLALELASHLGIAAHLSIELPGEFAWSFMRAALRVPTEQPFAPAQLRWRIFDVLGRWESDDDLTRYLADADPRKRFALADRLARVYDRCLLYRPEWIRAWQGGDTPHWQARVWRELAQPSATPRHWVDAVDAYQRARRHRPAAERPRQPELAFDSAPAPAAGPVIGRVSFFGITSLSPSYLDMLRSAAPDTAMHLFLLSPCREFWADTRSRRELPAAAGEAYLTEGNELLAAWGRCTREMQALLADDFGVGAPEERYQEPPADTRLGLVQRDILDLHMAADGGEAPPPDDSIQVHVCHSATREAEVLHDRLLDLFDSHDDVQPADVLVLTPDIDAYAPAIEAVFESAGTIPFNVGRQRRRDSAAVRAFLDLLALPGSRYGARAVLAPLRADSLASRFGIRDTDLAEIRQWLSDAGIRWGIDDGEADDVPTSARHTWRRGLGRLLLGYALGGEATRFGDTRPSALDRFGDASPDRYERLGRFMRYCEVVFGLDGLAGESRTAAAWAETMRTRLLAPFFATEHPLPDVAREADAVARLIEDVENEWHVAGNDGEIPFAVVRDALGERAAETSRSVARLADGVTIAPLRAGQVFPARVVCAVGMNDRDFPRSPAPASFDLVAADRRRAGDRDLRDEDRLAFLEALLAARRAFVVTYSGRDLREDSPIPPSVVMSEFGDYLSRRFGADGLETRHALQPFSARYFAAGDSPASDLFSFSSTMADAATAAARAIADEDGEHRLAGALPPPRLPGAEVELAQLVRFAASPARHFVRHRLGMRLAADEDDVRDEEPLELDHLMQWQVKSDLFDLDRAGFAGAETAALVRAGGLLPPGNLGRVELERSSRQVTTLQQALEGFEEQLEAPATPVDVAVGDHRLAGEVPGFAADALLFWRIGSIRAKDRIDVWLRLLALTAAIGRPVRAELLGVTRAAVRETIAGPAPEQASERLVDWLAAWRDGMTRPLPFFPNTSWAWISCDPDKNRDAAARRTWAGSPWDEGFDEHHRMFFGDDPIAHGFGDLATTLLGPLLRATR